MNIDEAINRLSNLHPITKEDEKIFNFSVDCMKFTRDFLPLGATPERMKHALNLLNSLEYVFGNANKKDHTQQIKDSLKETLANKLCVSESDHEWECCGISTAGTDYVCKKCHTRKIIPVEYHDLSVTI